MNERIKELAEQAANGLLSYHAEGDWYLSEKEVEKFAELIVEECCNWIDGSPSTDAGQSMLTKSFIISGLKGYLKGWSIRISDTSAIAYVLGDKNPELQANAHLIAAAPDLLEALTECLRYGAFLPPPILNVAKSALDKATGEVK